MNSHQSRDRGQRGKLDRLTIPRNIPPESLSKHLIINGIEFYDKSMGFLYFRCGEMNHRRPECKSRALEYWEQNYLKEIVFNNANSKFTGFRDERSLRYRKAENSNWRN